MAQYTFKPYVSYEVYLLDPFGSLRSNALPWIELDYTRVVNGVGQLKLILPVIFDPATIRRDFRIEVYRSNQAGVAVLDTETYWLVRSVVLSCTAEGLRTLEITAASANDILSTRIVAYNTNSAQAKKTGAADNLLRAVVRENLGSSAAVAARSLAAHLVIGSDVSKAPSVSLEFAHSVVQDVLVDICDLSFQNATPLYFDVVATGVVVPDLEFRVYTNFRGQDRRTIGDGRPLIIGPDTLTMNEGYTLTYDYSNEITYTYVGGPGIIGVYEEISRSTQSPYGRIEQWADYNGSGVTTVGYLNNQAKLLTRQSRYTLVLEGKITQTDAIQYGRDWGWGDYVSVQVENYAFDARVNGIHVNVKDNNTETVEGFVRSDT